MSKLQRRAAVAAAGGGDVHAHDERRKRQLARRRAVAMRLQGQGLVIILAAVVIIMWLSSQYFMSWDNLFTAASVVSILGVMAVAETLLVISGEIDISIGSVMAVSSVLIG